MVNFDFDKKCSGCGACSNICPVNAIRMTENAEGFLVPHIETTLCVRCGKCDTVCPHLNSDKVKVEDDVKGVWLYSSKNDNAKLRSSSGAACYEMGNVTLKSEGYVAGCIWDSDLIAKHDIGNSKDFLVKTQGSKYVQSDIGSVYRTALDIIKQGGFVLFTGTPCQATAMHNIIMASGNKEIRDRLITVAVICHGVASPLAWKSYKMYAAKKQGSKLVAVNFRDKSKEGYKKSYCHYEYSDGDSIYLPTFLPSSKYIEATLVYNLAIRNSCSHCDCKGKNEGIDLIVGDWYAEYQGEGRLGTSCIVAFTERGKIFVENSLTGLRDFDYTSVLKDNSFIEKSVALSPNRNKFFERIHDYNYWDKVEELYPSKYLIKKILVKTGLYGILKRFIG